MGYFFQNFNFTLLTIKVPKFTLIKFICFSSVIGQQTTPPELPIFGDAESEISLELIFQKTEPIFSLSGKTLQLLKPLDRDKDNLSHIIFQVCHTISIENQFNG